MRRKKKILRIFLIIIFVINNYNRFKFLNLFRLKLFTINSIWDIIWVNNLKKCKMSQEKRPHCDIEGRNKNGKNIRRYLKNI